MPSLSLRINLDPDGRIGPGKIELLEQIAAFGSISAAARNMDMSYKRAWDLVEEMNRLFGKPVVSAQTGGRKRRRRAAYAGRTCHRQPLPRHRAGGRIGCRAAYGGPAGGDRSSLTRQPLQKKEPAGLAAGSDGRPAFWRGRRNAGLVGGREE